jgi:hypothetical protein
VRHIVGYAGARRAEERSHALSVNVDQWRRLSCSTRPVCASPYGSRARSDARTDSDYDLLVVVDGEVDRRVLEDQIQQCLYPPLMLNLQLWH